MSADAPVWHHVWADEATKKAMAEAVRDAVRAAPVGRSTDDLWPELVDAVLSVLPDPTADTVMLGKVLLNKVQDDVVWMAKLARGSSWPGEMAHAVEQAANRVIALLGTDADQAAVAALLAGGDR